MEKTIAILGVTGSVGTQAVDVARKSNYKIDFITANKDVRGVEAFVREFSPRAVAMADESAAKSLKTLISDTATRVYSGNEGILEGILETKAETVINSIIGEAGLLPSLAVIDSGKRLALANKESLVIAGDIVMKRAKEKNVEIIPVDSEHSAIFQSMKAGRKSEVKKLILTASGGPFYGKTKEELKLVSLVETLAHPTWKMGRKITVDSATLMNKGFEIIEAAHLFSVGADKIEVVIHRESILHSAVEYIDNTVIGEFSVPDMRMCVGYAVDYPDRNEAVADELDLIKLGKLTFMKPDTEAFPLLALAGRAMSLGGAMPAVVNAADEIAVGAFLDEKISFADIPKVVISTFEKMTAHANDRTLEEILTADREAREIARGEIA
jgi:1-deoxy-D-xylulose-5-phosphate reductoisomerase